MKFSESWLREWVNPAISTSELAEQLSMAGLEVDAVEAVAGEFTGVVVGEVVACGQHPNADKLRVTKVNVGADALLDIVCGAANCRQGLKVAVAVVGATLPGNFTIKKAKLRGEPSMGMLCSFSELGISDDQDGIIELPADAPIGVDIREFLQLNDRSIEVDLTPNRADCLGIRGLAREVGVLNRVDVCQPDIAAVPATIDTAIKVNLDAPHACPRYLGRVVKGVDLSVPSPLWMKEKLRRSGMRSIDPIVDVTNYVLLELGQPMHAFDLQAINGDIHVRMAQANETLVLLDGEEVTLQADTLVIADSQKALAMAGIFGGKHSGVTAATQDILLESAFFQRDAIMGRARHYGLHTDASHRYERGVDPTLQRQAMERATALILQICGGQAGPVIEAVDASSLPAVPTIKLRAQRLAKVLGTQVASEVVTDILVRLGMQVTELVEGWQVEVPSYRFDLAIEEDLIEEVARVYGYNNIPNQAPRAALAMLPRQEADIPLMTLKQCLTTRGYNEAITYSFVDPKVQEALFPQHAFMTLPHPISSEMSAMRVSIWPGLLGAAAYNMKRQQQRIKLFESGLCFLPNATAPMGVEQVPMIAGLLCGSRLPEQWSGDTTPVDFFDAKGDVEALLHLNGKDAQISFNAAEHSALHPGMSAEICLDDQRIGWVGAIHPQFNKRLGINSRVFVFELQLSAVTQRVLPQAQALSKYPANRRDIAILVRDEVAVGDVLACIKKVGVNQLVALNLFDVYKGQGIAEGHKSLALSLILQDANKTLEEAEIQHAVDKVVEALATTFNATLRE